MRRWMLLLALSALSACAPGDSTSRGALSVRATEGEVFVDARDHGAASGEQVIDVTAGTHVVELRRGPLVIARASVEIRGGGTTGLALDVGDGLAYGSDAAVSGRLDLTSAPPGALLAIDGQDAGITPIAIDLVPGAHHIALSAPGYEPHEQDLFVGAGVSITLDVALVASP